jgi:hypothetical protein
MSDDQWDDEEALRRWVQRPVPGISFRKRLREGLRHGNWNPRRAVTYLPVEPKRRKRWHERSWTKDP